MSDKDGNGGGNRTVFRPSPLQGLNQNKPASQPAPVPGGASPFGMAPASGPVKAASLAHDDITQPAIGPTVRNRLMAEAGPVLALVASLRSGRTRPPLPQFHKAVSAAIQRFDQNISGTVPNETYQRARYALCSTVDDIAQNLPGQGNDTAEWARRSMVVTFFQENIGGDRFWQLVEDMLGRPQENTDLIELFHACLAAGFEGRFRIMPDGKRGLQEIMNRLFAALEHPRSQSARELVPHWQGEDAGPNKVGFWNHIALAAAIAAGVLMLIFIILRLVLMQTGHTSWESLAGTMPDERLRLSREVAAVAPPAAGGQKVRLEAFLAPEIAQGLVTVDQDAGTVRVRTTVGSLFKSGSDQLASSQQHDLFVRIGQAVEKEQGPVSVEGHSDSDRISSLSFPDNMALSSARAKTVAGILSSTLSDASRVTAQAFGDTQPVASNSTADGKALNRRVEIVLQRHD